MINNLLGVEPYENASLNLIQSEHRRRKFQSVRADEVLDNRYELREQLNRIALPTCSHVARNRQSLVKDARLQAHFVLQLLKVNLFDFREVVFAVQNRRELCKARRVVC